ncbi:PHP domain-containing protein [Geofilum sp. OHC36d9]|uniref:PHP domain-containing protein n=1 Tax=Geofilum sp. OHC36d9 TaxID=3458413 RepID=UPI00403464C8
MKTIDLHIHTTASDGSFTPTELIDYAVKKKLSAIAITDHDTMSGIQEAQSYIRNNNLALEFIPGMEVSTNFPASPYGIHILAYFIDKNEEKLKNILKSVRNEIQRNSLSSPEAIKIINKYGGLAVLAHPKDYFLNLNELDDLLGQLTRVGLKGIECIYPTHSEAETKSFKKLASQHELLITGGTDFHGTRKPSIDLGSGFGDLLIPYDIVDSLKAAIKNK